MATKSRLFLPAYLGVSVGSPYYSRQRMKHYLSYAEVNCPKFAFLIGDDLYRYTAEALKGLSSQQATERSKIIGSNLTKMLTSLCADVTIPCDIVRWVQLSSMDQYQKLYCAAKLEYENNSKFRSAVRNQIFRNLGDKPSALGVSRNPDVQDHRSRLLEIYILNEIAGLITISEFYGFPLEIYPGSDLAILKPIYRGDFTLIKQLIPSPAKRRFLRLRID
jgi:tRNA-dependent cyclodipeptide synthase